MRREASDPIEAYLRELDGRLHLARSRRRRILAEVREHLIEASEASGGNAGAALAIARFGGVAETACRFNELRRPRRVALARALAPWALAFGATSVATATVWAFQPARTPAPAAAAQAPRAAHCVRGRPGRGERAAGDCTLRRGAGR